MQTYTWLSTSCVRVREKNHAIHHKLCFRSPIQDRLLQDTANAASAAAFVAHLTGFPSLSLPQPSFVTRIFKTQISVFSLCVQPLHVDEFPTSTHWLVHRLL